MTVLVAPPTGERRVVLENIRWATYEALLGDLGPHPGKRLVYDRGLLEIMTTSPFHEHIKTLLHDFVRIITLELGVAIFSLGQATWKRKDLERGFEPDGCYYLGNEAVPQATDEIDLDTAPPADLVVEVDISRSSVNRRALYAAFGIRELWLFDGERIRFYKLRRDAKYVAIARSLAFPFLLSDDLDRFLAMRSTMDETRLMRAFRDWVRERIAG
jgi:Uma2 family endonuclease